jgi:hypothetical protein
MAITVLMLRTHCRERASPSSSGSTADRTHMSWINGALSRLYREMEFDCLRREKKLTCPPAETTSGVDSNLTVTQGSLTITRATAGSLVFTPKWLSERWALHVDAEVRLEFELAAITNPNATLRAGDEWTGTTATDKAFTFTKNKYLLTEASEVRRVEVIDSPRDVVVLLPDEFDRVKSRAPTQRGVYPRFCTFRNGYLEIWPSPGTTYFKLGITYRLAWTPLADAAQDTDVVVWDDQHLDVLLKAITLEASVELGEASPTPYPVALRSYMEALDKVRQIATKDMQPGPMRVQSPLAPRGRGRRSQDWIGTLEDA